MEDGIEAKRGDDKTLRWFRHVTTKVYVETQCSWEPCSKVFKSGLGVNGRFCTPACRMKDYRARKKTPEGVPE